MYIDFKKENNINPKKTRNLNTICFILKNHLDLYGERRYGNSLNVTQLKSFKIGVKSSILLDAVDYLRPF